MAKMPAAAASPAAPPDMSDDTDTDQTDGAAGAGDQGDDEPMVICTVMGHKDGSFTLMKGDEDDAEEGGEGDEGAAAAPGAPGGDEGSEDQGQSFTSLGDLLKGVMESVKEFQSENGGSSDQQNFEAGFAGADSTGPAAPPMPGAKPY